jgi:hypothetical protein
MCRSPQALAMEVGAWESTSPPGEANQRSTASFLDLIKKEAPRRAFLPSGGEKSLGPFMRAAKSCVQLFIAGTASKCPSAQAASDPQRPCIGARNDS